MSNQDSTYDYQGLTVEETLIALIHDLRSPSASLRKFSELMIGNATDLTDDEILNYLQSMQEMAERINTIIHSAALSEQVLELRK